MRLTLVILLPFLLWQEVVEFYLEAAQAAVLQLAQDLAAQEAGFQ